MHEQDNGTILLPDFGGWAFCYATILHYWSKPIPFISILKVSTCWAKALLLGSDADRACGTTD